MFCSRRSLLEILNQVTRTRAPAPIRPKHDTLPSLKKLKISALWLRSYTRTDTRPPENAPVLPVDLAVRVCDNVKMKPGIAAICAIAGFAICGGRAPAQFPDCAHTIMEAQGACEQGAQEVYVVNDRTDGQVQVTIRAAFVDASGTTTSTDQVLTLAAGEQRKLGCSLFAPLPRYEWTLIGCQPL